MKILLAAAMLAAFFAPAARRAQSAPGDCVRGCTDADRACVSSCQQIWQADPDHLRACLDNCSDQLDRCLEDCRNGRLAACP